MDYVRAQVFMGAHLEERTVTYEHEHEYRCTQVVIDVEGTSLWFNDSDASVAPDVVVRHGEAVIELDAWPYAE